MSEALKKLNQTISEDSHNVISLQGLEFGPTRSDSRAIPMTDLFGQVVAPVPVSQQRARAKGLKTLATSGLVGLASSASQDLQRSLESRLIKQLDSAGSTLFKQTWKRRVTPLGRRYLEHTASALRTGDSAFTSLPTPQAHDTTTRGNTEADGHYFPHDLSNAVQLSAVVSPQAGDADRGGQANRYLEKNHAVRLNDQAMLSAVPSPCTPNGGRSMSTERMDATGKTADGRKHTASLEHTVKFSAVPTPMAGTPKQNGYNEAGSTDYERKMDVALGLRERTNGPKLASVPTPKSSEHQATQKRGNLTLNGSAQLATVSTPTAQDHSRGNKDARPQDTGVPLSQQAALSTVSTPSGRDWKDTSGMSESGVDPDGSIRPRLDQLPRQEQLAAIGETATGGMAETKSIGQLAPDYSRWLQGLPPEWDVCAVTAMQSFRKSRKYS
jgi:hypothetical protein